MKKDIESLDYINAEYSPLERQMINSFQSYQTKNMREGNLKKSFIYLLIDPRIAENLLARSQVSNYENVQQVSIFNILELKKLKFNGRFNDALLNSQVITPSELWCRFLEAIFYVGKGKSSRPFAHLYDAIKFYRGN